MKGSILFNFSAIFSVFIEFHQQNKLYSFLLPSPYQNIDRLHFFLISPYLADIILYENNIEIENGLDKFYKKS